MLSFGIDTGLQSFFHSFITLPIHCSKLSHAEIRSSYASGRCCCYGNHTADSKPIQKLFIVVNAKNRIDEVVNWWSCVNCSSPVFLKHTVYIHTCCWCITVAQNAESLVCTYTGLCSAGRSHNKLAISSPVGVVLNFRCIESTRLTEWCLCTVSPRGRPSGVCALSVYVVDRVVFV